MLWMIVLLESLAAGFVQSVTGFGAGVIMMLVLPYLLNVVHAATLASVVCAGLTISLAWKYRKKVDWKVLLPLILSYTGAQSLTVHFVRSLEISRLSIVFGVFLVLLAVWYSFFNHRVHVKPRWYIGVLICALSGICGGLFGFGPMAALYLLPVTKDRDEYIGSTQMLFAFGNIANMAARLAGGLFPAFILGPAMLGIAGILLGKRMGLAWGERLSKERLSRIVYLFIALSGLIMIGKQLI